MGWAGRGVGPVLTIPAIGGGYRHEHLTWSGGVLWVFPSLFY